MTKLDEIKQQEEQLFSPIQLSEIVKAHAKQLQQLTQALNQTIYNTTLLLKLHEKDKDGNKKIKPIINAMNKAIENTQKAKQQVKEKMEQK